LVLFIYINIAHVTATCNPPINNFIGKRKNLTDPQHTNTSAYYVFMKIQEWQIFCGHNILIGVLVTRMSANAETCLTNCVTTNCHFTSDKLNTCGWFAEKGI